MATKKKTSSKKAPAKAKAKKSQRSTIDETRKIVAAPGQEDHFYKGFPRGLAYALLVKAPKRTMKVATFLDRIEKLDGVKSRAQARGIVAKLVGKPGDDGTVGQIARFV